MRIKTKQRLINVAAAACWGVAVGFVAWTIAFPPNLEVAGSVGKNFRSKNRVELPSDGSLEKLLVLQLQGPLETPITKVAPAVVKPVPVPWPAFSLECIFFGNESKLAVFSANGTKYRCIEGDMVLDASVDRIEKDEVKVTFRGEQRTFRPLPDSENKR